MGKWRKYAAVMLAACLAGTGAEGAGGAAVTGTPSHPWTDAAHATAPGAGPDTLHGAMPDEVAGAWGTAASLHDGTGPQTQLYLLADGYGALVGSSAAPVRVDGKGDAGDDGKRAPRAIIGYPIRAGWHDGVLTARPLIADPVQAAKAARMVLTCHLQPPPAPRGTALVCSGPVGTPMVLQRLGGGVPADITRVIDAERGKAQ